MAQPMFTINSGAISGAVWEGKYGPQPSIRKAKKTKDGKFEKDENGKQVYTDYYNRRDLLDISFVALAMANFMATQPKSEPEF